MTCREKIFSGLTGNQLKILAMVTMTMDHVGLYLLPRFGMLRILGRLALPIYAYLIAEGCRHTRSQSRYLLRILGLGAACQVVYYLVMGSLYQCILITFSLSILLIVCLDRMNRAYTLPNRGLVMLAFAGTGFVCQILPLLLPGTDFGVDYGILGVFLPVLAYLGKERKQQVLLLSLGLILLAWDLGGIQWFSLGAAPLLLCYNGRRGEMALGRLFYLYYPLHLAVIYGIGLLLR